MLRRTVLHVAQPTEAGVARVVETLAADQARRDWDVVVACPPVHDLPGWAADAGARVVAWSATRSPGPAVTGETRQLLRIVETVDPDIVHLHSAKAGLVGRLALRGRLPTVFEPNAWSFEAEGPTARPARVWERLAARWTDAVLCVSEQERRLAQAAGISAPLEVVGNGIDVDAWPALDAEARGRARKRLGIASALPLAVCVGRLGHQKNQHALLDAWPLIRERIPGAEIALIGDGPDRAALERRGVAGVRFEGVRDDVPDWLAAADLVVQSSRYEGLSIALLEAAASARSVVSTEVAGAEEVLSGGAGAIVPQGDRDALVDAVGARLADPDATAAEGRAARAVIERRFSLAAVGDRVAEVYAKILAAR